MVEGVATNLNLNAENIWMHLLAAFWFTPSIGMLNLTAESENADVLPRIIPDNPG